MTEYGFDPVSPPNATAPTGYARFSRRLGALIADGAILAAAFIALLFAAAASGSQLVLRGALLLLVLAALLYDPILVSTTGGTLGHRWLNLRVVADETGGRLTFGRALIRGLIKGILGIVSFIFMGVTTRHQAVHDLVSKSTVQIRDPGIAKEYYYVAERVVEEPTGVSRTRRVLVILGYVVAGFMGMSVLSVLFISEECALSNRCTPGENLRGAVLGLGWIGASAAVLYNGWRGRLPGCRSVRQTADEGLSAQ